MADVYLAPEIKIILCAANRLSAWNHGNLSAPYWRFYWNRQAGALVELNDVETALEPGRFLLIPPNTPYSSRLRRPVDHLYVHFVVSPMAGALQPEVFSFKASTEDRAMAEEIFELTARGSMPQAVNVLRVLSLVANTLAKVPPDWLEPRRLDSRVDEAIRLMDSNLPSPLSNSALAKAVSMHTNAFIRLFRSQTGVSPQEFFRQKRVDHASMMLHHGQASIKEIAEESGFCDRYHFSRVFKAVRGVSPAEFRRQIVGHTGRVRVSR